MEAGPVMSSAALEIVPPARRILGRAVLCEKFDNAFRPMDRPREGGWWEIECEPHVMLKLKRTFGRADVRSFGKLQLRATDEVCRDLQWFCERYPLEVEPRDYLDARAGAHDRQIVDFENLLAGAVSPRAFKLSIPARQYQQIATDLWLRAKGLLVADDVGLGKTLIAIAGFTRPETRPALVVTLAHLPMQWEREVHKFAPGLRTHILKKGTPYDVTRPHGHRVRLGQGQLFEDRFPDVLICNYHKLSGWAETLATKIRTVVFDECQELRRSESLKYFAAKHLTEHSEYALGLSATPIYNYGDEMFNVISVLRRDALGTRDEFMREWCNDGGWGGRSISSPKAFGTYLRETGLMIRRTRSDVGRELPAVIKVPHYIEADVKALDNIADSAAELARIILSKNTAVLERGQAARDLDWRLRQATGISKAPYVADFVEMLIESGEKVVLYGWHREVYSIWAERLKEYNPVFFTGTESANRKEESRKAFCEGDAKILVMSLRAGAGLDGLQYHTRTAVFGELDWSPGVHEQNEGRLSRDGQRDPVVAYYLLSDHGSDPVVADVLGLKREQIQGIRDPKADLIEKLESAGDRIKKLAAAYLKQRGQGMK